MQLLDQSPINFDEVVFRDLTADYNRTLDQQVLTGSGSAGQLESLVLDGYLAGLEEAGRALARQRCGWDMPEAPPSIDEWRHRLEDVRLRGLECLRPPASASAVRRWRRRRNALGC